MKSGKNQKRGKYANELEKLRELSAIKEVLKKSDIENAALTNTSKDSETVNDNVIDNMLNQLQIDKNSNRDLEIVESLASQGRKAQIIRSIKAKQARRISKPSRKIKRIRIARKPLKKKSKKKR